MNVSEKYQIDLNNMSRDELLQLQSEIFKKLTEFVGHSDLKKGQKIVVGNTFAGKEPFYRTWTHEGHILKIDEYENIVGEYGFIESDELETYAHDENGNVIPSVSITLERDKERKRKPKYDIHPEDAILVEEN